jgi:hypothetical protein
MKSFIRLSACILVIAAAVAGNSLPKPASLARVHRSVNNDPTPIPMCNPFTDKCPPIR